MSSQHDSAALTSKALNRSCLTFMNQPQHMHSGRHLTSSRAALTIMQAAFQNRLEWPQGQVLFVGFVMETVQTPGMSRVDRIAFVQKTIDAVYPQLMNLRIVWVPDNWDESNPNEKHLLNSRRIMTANVLELKEKGLTSSQIETYLSNIANQVEGPKQVPMIRISFNVQGAYSYVGVTNAEIQPFVPTNPGRTNETMGLGWLDEDKKGGVCLHEMGHCIGLMHEHQRPDAKGPDKLNLIDEEQLRQFFMGPPNYWDDATIQANVIDVFDYSTRNASKYDPNSIMHYIMDCNMFKEHQGPPGLACQVPMCPKRPCCAPQESCDRTACPIDDQALARLRATMPNYQCDDRPRVVNNTQELSEMDKQTIMKTYPPPLGDLDLKTQSTSSSSSSSPSSSSSSAASSPLWLKIFGVVFSIAIFVGMGIMITMGSKSSKKN